MEDGEVTPGFASVAAVVLDHTGHPAAGVAVTYPSEDPPGLPQTIAATRRTAERISARIGGQAPAGRSV
jgi:DNA-binding IclR family transcriptional regulator